MEVYPRQRQLKLAALVVYSTQQNRPSSILKVMLVATHSGPLRWLLCLFLLAVRVLATGRAGAFERLFLWNAYNILMDDDPGQKVILKIGTRKGDPWTNNKGSGPGNRLTFQEFMDRVDNRPQGRCQIEGPRKEIKDKDPGRSLQKVAEELDAAGYDHVLNVRILKSDFSSTQSYADFLHQVTTEVSKKRASGDMGESGSVSGDNYRKWDYSGYVADMRTAAEAVESIRSYEFRDKYLKWALAETFDLWKKPMPKIKAERQLIDEVVLEDAVTNKYEDATEKYTFINIEETMKNAGVQAKIKAVFQLIDKENAKKWRKTFRDWVRDCGELNPAQCANKKLPKFPDEVLGHRKVLNAVRNMRKSINADAGCQ